ncbi:MAG: insulinase family protein [Clostridia bacterium]|nr:insulinase family protein [Clostridia bacterium]
MDKKVFESDIGESYILATLDNGLKVYICEMPQFTSAYAVFGTKYGSIDTAFSLNGGQPVAVPEGIAHFLEHKLFESEEGDAFSKYAETGAMANAFTSFDRTCYLFSCSDRFEENLDILLSFVQSPYFTEETVKKEQGIIGQEIRMYDDSPSWRVLFNMLGAMYINHPVKIDIAGTVDSIAKINSDLLYECYNTFYNPSNMFVCIAGNVDARAVLKKIEAAVADRGANEITRGGIGEPESVVKNYVEQAFPVLTPIFCFGYKQKIGSPFRRLKSKICVELLLEIICGESSPLYKRLMDEGLINDEFDFEYFTGRDYAAAIFSGESENPARVADEIKKEIANIREHGFDKKLFSAVKCAAYGDALRRFNSVEMTAMQLTECAVCDYDLFEQIKLLKTVSYDDVLKRTDIFDDDLSVLSVIKPQEG